MSKFRSILIELIKDHIPMVIRQGTVKSVNESDLTAEIHINDEIHLGVRLGLSDMVYCIPEVESEVYFAFVENEERMSFLILCSAISKYLVKAGDRYIQIDHALIKLSGDTYGGLVKVESLVDRLNNIEDAFNSFLKEYKLHVHGGVTVGVGVSLIMNPASMQTSISKSNKSQLENTKIKHG